MVLADSTVELRMSELLRMWTRELRGHGVQIRSAATSTPREVCKEVITRVVSKLLKTRLIAHLLIAL